MDWITWLIGALLGFLVWLGLTYWVVKAAVTAAISEDRAKRRAQASATP